MQSSRAERARPRWAFLGWSGEDDALATWVIGDVHGCADELERLLDGLELAAGDRVVALGDLFHRGPAPLGVARALARVGAVFVLGNHEHALLRRLGWRPEAPERWPSAVPAGADLRGDSGRALRLGADEAPELLAFLRGHAGYFVASDTLPGAGSARDGRGWCAVHAGLTPGRSARESRPEDLVLPARGARGGFWYEDWRGPELVLFGHLLQGEEPRVVAHAGRTVAIGLDTGAVYGGRLTAYSPERDAFRSVRAGRAYVTR